MLYRVPNALLVSLTKTENKAISSSSNSSFYCMVGEKCQQLKRVDFISPVLEKLKCCIEWVETMNVGHTFKWLANFKQDGYESKQPLFPCVFGSNSTESLTDLFHYCNTADSCRKKCEGNTHFLSLDSKLGFHANNTFTRISFTLTSQDFDSFILGPKGQYLVS